MSSATCGTTEVVPFPVVALPESSEGWGCGIPPFANDARPFDLAQGGLWGIRGSARAEARAFFWGAGRGAEAPLFHGGARAGLLDTSSPPG
jgi:hypothetical protein